MPVLLFAVLVATHTPDTPNPPIATAPADVLTAPVPASVPAPLSAPVPAPVTAPPSSPSASDVETEVAWSQMHGVLAGAAAQARMARHITAVGAGAVSAAMIGVGITYVAVGNVDVQLSTLDADDTRLAGYIAGAGAVVPAAIMIGALVSSSEEEARLAAFKEPGDRQGRVAAARASLSESADSTDWWRVAGGGALIAGGLVGAGVGGRFIQLPHLAEPRGIVSHSIGAELIGAGVMAAVVGGACIATSGSSAGPQLAILAE